MNRPSIFGVHVDRLVSARAVVMRTRPKLGELLCTYRFVVGLRTDTLTRSDRTVLYNPDFVASASDAEIVAKLEAIALRDAAKLGS